MQPIAFTHGVEKEKEQDEFHPAPFLDKRSSTEIHFKYIMINNNVKSGTYKSLPLSLMCPISAPQAGLEPTSDLSVEDRFIRLSYRGELSFVNNTTIYDNISSCDSNVN